MSILRDLYFGNFALWEGGRPKDPNYTPLTRKASEIKEHFRNTLSSEDKKRFEEMQNLQSKYGTIEEVHLFEYAFCMGALMMIDVFNFKERKITDLADVQEKRSKAAKMNTAKCIKMNIFLQTVNTMLSSVKNFGKKHMKNVKSPSKIGRDRAHLLSGILKCPKCGGPMYTNKHAWTNKDGTYKEIYYYVCSKARTARGKSCDYKTMLKKTDIEPLVIEAIRELIKNEDFAIEIKSKIGKQIDTSTLDRELKNYEGKLREVDLNKTRLENEIDSLSEDARFRERKLHDMTLRLDGLYDIIVELEEKIEDVKLRRKAVEQDAITLENIYTLLANFDKVYDKISDEEKKSLISSLIKEIEIFPCGDSELPLKSILFNFPVYKDGGDVYEFLWDKSTHVSI